MFDMEKMSECSSNEEEDDGDDDDGNDNDNVSSEEDLFSGIGAMFDEEMFNREEPDGQPINVSEQGPGTVSISSNVLRNVTFSGAVKLPNFTKKNPKRGMFDEEMFYKDELDRPIGKVSEQGPRKQGPRKPKLVAPTQDGIKSLAMFDEEMFNREELDGQSTNVSEKVPGLVSISPNVSRSLKCCINLITMCENLKQQYDNYYKVIRVAITSLLVCFIDSGTDVLTTVSHFRRCHWWWGSYSAILIILPLTWIGYNLIKREMWNHKDFKEKWKKKMLITCLILQVLVVCWFIWKFRTWWRLIKECKGNKKGLPKERLRKDLAKIKNVKSKEGQLEGGLQLALQGYILLRKIKNAMGAGHCPDNCNKYAAVIDSPFYDAPVNDPPINQTQFNQTQYNQTRTFSSNELSYEYCIDIIQIVGIIISLLAVCYSQAFMYYHHRKGRQLIRFFIYVPLVSIRMFIPAVLAVFGKKATWFLAPVSSLICYSLLYYTRRTYTTKGYILPNVLKMETQKRDTVLKRTPSDILYWGLNHMLFNVSSVSGLAISFPYMICTLPFVIVVEKHDLYFSYFYGAATGLTVTCVFINLMFVIFFRNKGKMIINSQF